MDNYNYPYGADTADAPWNEKDSEDVEMNIILKISAPIDIDTYSIKHFKDFDGDSYCDGIEVDKSILLDELFDRYDEFRSLKEDGWLVEIVSVDVKV